MFKTGQLVVCKIVSPTNTRKLKAGQIYTIKAITHCESCGRELLILHEISDERTYCFDCGFQFDIPAFSSWRFEPLKFEKIDIKDLIKEIVEEGLDIPVKEKVL